MAASGGRSSFTECCLCGLLEEENMGLAVSASQSSRSAESLGRDQVCVYHCLQTTNTVLRLHREVMFATRPCLFVVWGFFSDRVPILDRPVTQRSLKV